MRTHTAGGTDPTRILLVEDNPGDALLLEELLAEQRDGPPEVDAFRVDHVQTLREALDALAREPYDCVVLDLSLPDSLGMETVIRLREREPLVPVVVMTGNATDSVEVAALHHGAQDYVIKGDGYRPTLPNTIRHAIRRQDAINTQHRAQAALARSEQAFRGLIESSPDAILVQRSGLLTYLNPTAVDYLSLRSESDRVGKPLFDLIHPQDRTPFEDLLQRVEREATPQRVSALRFHQPGGEFVIADVVALPVDFDGGPCLLIVARDVTEIRQAEFRIAMADRVMGSGILAAGMAHEINNPLSYVIGNALFCRNEVAEIEQEVRGIADRMSGAPEDQALLRKLANQLGQSAEALSDCHSGADRIKAIVRDLRILSDQPEMQHQTVDPRDIVRAAVKLLRQKIVQRCRLIEHYDELPRVAASPGQLGQVFVNLISNAIHALPEDGAHANEIRITAQRMPSGDVAIDVADTGDGMTPEVQERVFDPFFTTRSPGDGRGLGLAICHSILRDIGGHIEVESEPGAGTRFRVVLRPATP